MRTLAIGVVLAAALAGGAARADSVVPDPFAPGAAATPAPAPETPAADAKPAEKPKPHKRAAKPRAPSGAVTVTIFNKRTVGLVELDVGPAGGELKNVQGALAFGRKAVVHLPRAKDCLYDIKGRFADDADTAMNGIDLCKDKTLNLTDE